MKDEFVLGIDTSNYTTSVAILNTHGELIANLRRLLPVKQGERGLRQSEAVFSHIKNIPLLMEEVKTLVSGKRIVAIGVSEKPRNAEGSYMPCFLSGVAVAQSMAAATGAPLYRFSHQCGHIMSALYSCNAQELLENEFCAFHVSGGTTEVLRVVPDGYSFKAEKLGGALDLNAGQVIDRVGVALGLSFPAGAELEALAMLNDKKIPKKSVSTNGFNVSLSGLENLAAQMLSKTSDKSLVAAFVFDYVAKAILHLSEECISRYGDTPIVYAGGVMRNTIIKKALSSYANARFAEPDMSSDNAVGIAALALRAYNSK